MSPEKLIQRPVQLKKTGKTGLRTQFGALCWRVRKDQVEIALVKSRRRKRWIIPKGWPMHGMTPVAAASLEAWEEAGIRGQAMPICIGLYSYMKMPRDGSDPLPCVVAVFPLKARSCHDEYPECSDRKRKWVTCKKAAALVSEPELSQIIRRFDPSQLKP
ncbi:NUDIX hydrolase [Celeribacter arenosi]